VSPFGPTPLFTILGVPMNEQQDTALVGWVKLLNPRLLRSNLIGASLFLVAYELLRDSVIDQIRSFVSLGDDDCGPRISPEYKQDVLCRHTSQLRASLLWLKDRHAVDDADIALVDQIERHRNELAHELPKFLLTAGAEINAELLMSVARLVAKIDRWWIREVHVPSNAEFDEMNIDEVPDSEIHSGNMIVLQLLIQIATEPEEDSLKRFEEFIAAVETHGSLSRSGVGHAER
jgi:hypothetical protein